MNPNNDGESKMTNEIGRELTIEEINMVAGGETRLTFPQYLVLEGLHDLSHGNLEGLHDIGLAILIASNPRP